MLSADEQLDIILSTLVGKYKGQRLGSLNNGIEIEQEFDGIIDNSDELRGMLDKLIGDGFICRNNAHELHHIQITTAGKEFIAAGGYKKQSLLKKKLEYNAAISVRQNWIVIILTGLSLIATIFFAFYR